MLFLFDKVLLICKSRVSVAALHLDDSFYYYFIIILSLIGGYFSVVSNVTCGMLVDAAL